MVEKKTIICRCEEITEEEIIKAINEGYDTIEELKRVLRIGMGPCQGRTCLRLVTRILMRITKKKWNEIDYPTVRPPIRPVPLGVFSIEESKDTSK